MRTALQNITIYAPNVNNNGTLNAIGTFPITDQCERSAQLMGDDYVRLIFKSAEYITFPAFSFIRLSSSQIDKEQTFFLKEDYRPQSSGSEKTADGVSAESYSYDVKFYSIGNMLRKPICYRHVKVSNGASANDGYQEWDEPELNVSADLSTMYVIIMESIAQYTNRISSTTLFQKMLATLPANGLTTVGGITEPSTDVKLTKGTELSTFNFSGAKIADVCTGVANQFTDEKKETEWYIEETAEPGSVVNQLIMHFCKCDNAQQTIAEVSDFAWKNTSSNKYLRPVITGGLSKVDYSRDTSNIPQIIVPFGAERNMTYESVKGIDIYSQMQSTFGKRVRLTPNTTYEVRKPLPDGTYEDTTVTTDDHGGLTNDQVNTGDERVEFFDKVYPQCHFRVTKVETRMKKRDDSVIPEYTCTAVAIDSQGEVVQPAAGFFPIQIEEGATLSVRFESGYLNGREFEIANKTQKEIDPDTHQPTGNYSLRFTIVADGSIEDGTLIPSGNFIPRARDIEEGGTCEGDEFALFNMKMPQVYIDYARQELAQAAYEKLLEYQETLPDMKCTSMARDFHGISMSFGKRFNVHSEKIGFRMVNGQRTPIDFISRVTAFSYKLTKPDDIQFTLSSAIARGVLSEMASAISTMTSVQGGLGQTTRNLSRRGWRDASEVAEKLDSITSEMMLVGNEKYQFAYTCGIDCVDANDNPTIGTSNAFAKLHISYGQLQHTQEPYIGWHGGLWEIGEADIDTDLNGVPLDANKAYYVYAICSENNTTASIVLSEDSSAADTDMLLGILSSVFEDQRVFSPTNGYTSIMGGQITTEQIQDAGRNLIIDFSSNPPRIIARGGAQIIGNISFLSNGSVVDAKTYIDQIDVNLQQQIDGNITSWFYSGVPTLENAPASKWATVEDKDKHLGDLYYDNNTGYCYRFLVENKVYKWEKIVDNDVVLALRNVDDVTNDKIISKGSEKINLKKEWLEVAGQNLNGTTDGTYYKATTEADNYRLTYGALTSAFTTLKGYMDALLANVGANSYLSDYEGTLPEGAAKLSFTHTQLNNAWKNYYTEEAALNNRIALVGSGSVNLFPKKFMDDWNTARPTNLFSKAAFSKSGCDVFQDKCLMCSTRTTNTSASSNYFAVRRMIDSTHVYPSQGEARFVYMNTIGQFSGSFTKDSNWHYLQVYFNGNNANAQMLIDADALFENGKTYYITGLVSILDRSGSGNHAQVEDLYIYEGSETYYLNEYIGYRAVDSYGEYFAVNSLRLYDVIGSRESYNDILQGKVTFEAGKQYTLKVKWCSSSVVNYDTLYLGFKYSDGTRSSWIQCSKDQTTPVVQSLVSDEGKNVVGIACTFGSSAANTRIYDISLTEGAYPPFGWIEAEEDKVQGGETLANYATADVHNMTKVGESGFRQVLADTKSELALTIDDYETGRIPSNNINTYVLNASVKLGRQAFSFIIRRATKVLRIKHNGSQQDVISTFTLDEPLAKGTRVVVSLEFVNISQGSFEWKDVMIQVGNKATDYQRYYQYLAQAFENDARAGQTNIEGGLIATSLIKLRDQNNNVTAGMSGLKDYTMVGNNVTNNGVTLWGGGDYADALAQAAYGVDYTQLTKILPILLTKTGFGSCISCFRVIDKDTIKVVTENNEIVISNKSISEVANISGVKTGNATLSYDSDPMRGTTGEVSKTISVIGEFTKTLDKGNYQAVNTTSAQMALNIYASTQLGQSNSSVRTIAQARVEMYVKVGATEVGSIGICSDGSDAYAEGTGQYSYKATTIQLATNTSKTISFEVLSNSTEVKIGFRIVGACSATLNNCVDTCYGRVQFSSTRMDGKIVQTDHFVAVAKDGIAVINGSEAAFTIYNGNGDMDVQITGLPQTKPNEKGKLYQYQINSSTTVIGIVNQ